MKNHEVGSGAVARSSLQGSMAAFVFVFGCSSGPAQPGAGMSGAASSVAGAVSAMSGAGGTIGGGGAPSLAGASAIGGAGASAVAGASNGGGGSSSGGTGGSGGTLSQAGAGGSGANPPSSGAGGGGGTGGAVAALPKRVLLYHFSTLDIASVPAQLTFFKNKLTEWQYESDDTVDPTQLTDQNLQRYAAVAMINTCFEPFGKGNPDKPQSEVLQRFLQRGGGLFGTHCASVTFQSATPAALYNQLIGGRGANGSFDGTSDCRTLVATHPTTSTLPATFTFSGNLDNTDYLATDTVVLVKCKWQGTNGKDVNVSWYRNEGPGRVFYTDFAKVDTDL
ncbi:MAG TPA: ThuA domain-containing protein, partial [Polyangiaceae bacterium]